MSDSAAPTSARLEADCLKSPGGGGETSEEKRSASLLIWPLSQSEMCLFISHSDGGGRWAGGSFFAVFSPLIPTFPESASCGEVSEGCNWEDDEPVIADVWLWKSLTAARGRGLASFHVSMAVKL